MNDSALSLLEYNFGAGIRAFSTTRHGGCGKGNYDSLNITHYCNDDPENVRKNRALLCAELSVTDEHLILPRQTHGIRHLSINSAFFEKNAAEKSEALDSIDALTTNMPGVCIGISTADCIPILLYDKDRQAIAAIHAGWRGTVARITESVINAMTHEYGTDPGKLTAVIGPGISESAFEVGDEVYAQFSHAGFPMQDIARKHPSADGEKWHIDLWAANYLTLERCGLEVPNIQVCGICTYTEHHQFFSARRLGINSGRIFTGVMLTQ